jgi:hypothetical protein
MDHAPRITAGERVISVSLSEADWQEFVASTPQPVNWVKQRILEEVAKARQQTGASRKS